MKRILPLVLIGLLTALVGCGRENGQPLSIHGGKNNVAVDKTKYMLAQEPKAAQGVVQVREKSKDGDAVVVVGRIGGEKKSPFVNGLAAFTIVDTAAIPCNEIEGDNCPTPWDYCCDPDLAKKKVLVKFVDEQGQTLGFDAEKGLELQPLQTVVVQGKVSRSADGGISILAQGVFVRP